MKIEARISNLMPGDSNVKAIATATFDDCLAVRNIKVMSGKKGLFVSMPSVRDQDGNYTDICFPVTAEFRAELNKAVETAYRQAITQLQEQQNVGFAQPEQTNEQTAPTMTM